MSFFDSLFRRGRKRASGDPGPVDPALRRAVEEAVAADDAAALAARLRDRQPEGKRLIREYQREMEAATEREEQLRLARLVTAMVTLYDRAFRDRQPMGWFHAAPGAPPVAAAVRLREAQDAFAAADFTKADTLAGQGLLELGDGPHTGEAAALESTLLAVRGAIALREERAEDARAHFEKSLHSAGESGRPDARTAALLNLIDLHTRGGQFEEAAPYLDETVAAAPGTQFEDVTGKLFVERGVALMQAGNLTEAIATLDRACALKPQWPFPLYQRGWAHFLSGDSGSALDDYRAAAAIAPVFFTVQREIRCLEDVAAGRLPVETYRSYCLIREKVRQEPQEVLDGAMEMLTRHAEFAPAYLLAAEALLALGNAEAARDGARDALTHDPDPDTAAAALFFIWNLSRQMGDPESAAEAAERLQTAYRDHAPAVLISKLQGSPTPRRGLRWTFALDGTLHFEELPPDAAPPGPPPATGSA